jgi:hypothetical protein
MDVTRKKQMKYEDIKKMGEAWAQVQEKQRQANTIRAEAMLKAEAETISANVGENKKVDEKGPKIVKGKDASVKGIAKASDKYAQQNNDASNDKSDDGDGMDKVDPKAAKKKFKDRKDKDIDNDGDTDDSDEYLHKRRKAISKNSDSNGKKEVEVQTSEMSDMEKTRSMAKNSIGKPKPKQSGGTGVQQNNQKEGTVKEAASTGKGKNSDNPSSPPGEGLAPNAKDQLAAAMKTPAIDGQKSIDLTFASFKKMSGKKSKDNK